MPNAAEDLFDAKVDQISFSQPNNYMDTSDLVFAEALVRIFLKSLNAELNFSTCFLTKT